MTFIGAMFPAKQRVGLILENHTPCIIRGNVLIATGSENLPGNNLLLDSQCFGNFSLRQAFSEEVRDIPLRLSPARALKPEQTRDPIQNVIELTETMKYTSKGFDFLSLFDCSTGGVQRRPINVNGVFLNRSVKSAETDADAEFALRQVLLQAPNHVGNRGCRI